MNQALKIFTTETDLFKATEHLLAQLHIRINRVTAESMNVAGLYNQKGIPMPQYLQAALMNIKSTYFIGVVNDQSLAGSQLGDSLDGITETIQQGGRYDGMFVFACDAKEDATLTRTAASALTRAFNHIASANPVILLIRQGELLSISTCERMAYSQEWRQGEGERLGKVAILRDINCANPHRGHLDILETLRSKECTSFEELYNHWMETFSTELLTRKFYNELSDWYAWAIKVIRFPNDINDPDDDEKYNHEGSIRLITRLIFVWFLKQKHLIPKEFFDEDYLRENLLKDFDPHMRYGLFNQKTNKTIYYKAILQNLFFAMLNCPLTENGSSEVNVRRFRTNGDDVGYSRLLCYQSLFKDSGKFIELANTVPFLNGGLFDCIDDREHGIFYDAFSERLDVQKGLVVPDYLFFGDNNGEAIDLSEFYGDKNKKKVKANGIIDILKKYHFTVEENTPYDQEVSLDPELLGKVFENLLASYNPETQSTARKQTGSFYTPREIVQYMVTESMVAHLKRTVGEELEPEYRHLLSYGSDAFNLSPDQRREVMQSIYQCKILDPACGSGAFPMGILQQMVHVLGKIDPDNTMWRELMVKQATDETSEAFNQSTKEERDELLADISRSFDVNINRPDYARKLYLVENCIYGVDIQSIAIQISKLRFFISLVIDQVTNDNPADNFGIRPLPNLEAKFVAANTLIGLSSDLSLGDTEVVQKKKAEMKEVKHRIFNAKTYKTKLKYKNRMAELRQELTDMLLSDGFVTEGESQQLAAWDMFDQNASSPFFDPNWMFGVKDGFDVVIGNPPYVVVGQAEAKKYYKDFKTLKCQELYAYFFERSVSILQDNATLAFITGSLYTKGIKFESLRYFLENNTELLAFRNEGDKVFENVGMPTSTILLKKKHSPWSFDSIISGGNIISKMEKNSKTLADITKIQRGLEIGRNVISKEGGDVRLITGSDVVRYVYKSSSYVSQDILEEFQKDGVFYTGPRMLIRETGSQLTVLYTDEDIYCNRSLYTCLLNSNQFEIKYLIGILSSSAIQFYYSQKFKADTEIFPKIRIKQAKMLPIPIADKDMQQKVVNLVDNIIEMKKKDVNTDISSVENQLNRLVCQLFNLTNADYLEISKNENN